MRRSVSSEAPISLPSSIFFNITNPFSHAWPREPSHPIQTLRISRLTGMAAACKAVVLRSVEVQLLPDASKSKAERLITQL